MLRRDRESTVYAALVTNDGRLISSDQWSFAHSRPKEFEAWFQGRDHARMLLTDGAPSPYEPEQSQG